MGLGVSIYIIVLVVLNIVGCFWLLHKTKNLKTDETADGKVNHSYDGIEEYNKPLPRWWLYLFYITLVFSIGYLVLYPGFGHFQGTLGWTSANQYDKEAAEAEAKVAPMFAAFAAKSVEELARDPKAMDVGARLFGNNCATCHGSDAKGGPGFPNLTDKDWLWGGDAEAIKTTIMAGRQGMMPAHGAMFDETQQIAIRHHVMSLSGREHDAKLAADGKPQFETICAACHGVDGKGNQMLGAPNLTDNIWLHGGTHGALADIIKNGRTGVMPAHADLLGAERVHVLAAYVWSLSNNSKAE